ncbi:FAD-binding protein [Legionella yabuuchiae]|uniref:FAD-binding protein n=1 Tax=Legionella yabuuchiae TaxID=376727 RepID=UPI0010543D04|nr:FAD-binding protein [Legionella yabuuchiae]
MPFTQETRRSLLSSLVSHKISFEQTTWKNFMGNIQKFRAIVIQVDNESQVQEVVRAVKRLNDDHPEDKISIRAVAGWRDAPGRCDCFFPSRHREARYNESFSFLGDAADVLIRFSKKFQHVKKIRTLPPNQSVLNDNPLESLPVTVVEVTAGIQIAALAEAIHKMGLSLRTVSMIPWVSAVGLAATGGHGTGRDEPSFSGQLVSMTICDFEGNIRTITEEDADFKTLSNAHIGMLGVVLKVELKTVERFKLEETIHNFKGIASLKTDLSDLLSNNQYFTLMHIPTYERSEGSDESLWHVRLWNYTKKPNVTIDIPAYAADELSFVADLSAQVGDSIEGQLTQPLLHDLLPAFMRFTAAVVLGSRGDAPQIGYEKNMTHYQAAFPKEMHDVSYMIAVKETLAGQTLGDILDKLNQLLHTAGRHGEYPITYAVYVRFLKGSNGGLSSTYTVEDDEKILAIDLVTHPNAPGWSNLEQEFNLFLNERGIKPRHHLGKNMPTHIKQISDFLDPHEIEKYKNAVANWYGSQESFKNSPFLTTLVQELLFEPNQSTFSEIDLEDEILPATLQLETMPFLNHLIAAVESTKVADEYIPVKNQLIEQCKSRLASLALHHGQGMVSFV